jgi:hypothetical protein
MNKTDVTAMRALDIKMVEKFANEVPARMVCFLRIHVCVDVQLSLVVRFLARHINFQNNVC